MSSKRDRRSGRATFISSPTVTVSGSQSMIYYVTRQEFNHPVIKFIHGAHSDLSFIRPISYEQLFAARKAPAGNYIFTDFDRLTPYDIQGAAWITDALRAKFPDVVILNNPREAMERYTLLKTLHQEGINRFTVTRLDGVARPEKYPVFVRTEDGARGSESGLCNSSEELEATIRAMREEGKVLKRRIAVEFCAKPDETGYYRKYGALNINGVIVPQHIFISRDWMVKGDGAEFDETFAAEELDYVRANPHRDELLRIFKIARIDVGRVDYGIVDGMVQIFEINTNPHFPRFNVIDDHRSERRRAIRGDIINAFQAINASSPSGSRARFSMPSSRERHMRKPYLWRNPMWLDRLLRELRRTTFYRRLKGFEKDRREQRKKR
jgi:hypothetical protein